MSSDPLSWIYGVGVSLRNRRYDRNPSAAGKLPVPVASVGNLTVGGSGKTPLVAAIARELLRRRRRVAVLSRGYGRRSKEPFVLASDGRGTCAPVDEAGDEPMELARAIPGLVVAVGPDRLRVGRELLGRMGPHVLLLDDGFQHRRLYRDLDLVCLDAEENEKTLRLLPRGRLREPLGSLGRADALVWTRCAPGRPDERLEALVRAAAGRELPVIRSRIRLTGFTRWNGSPETMAPDGFQDRPVGVLLGLARPVRVLESIPARIVFETARRDHHWWSRDEVLALSEEAKRRGASALLTTGKDAVKMPWSGLALPLYVIDVEAEILDGVLISQLLDRLSPA